MPAEVFSSVWLALLFPVLYQQFPLLVFTYHKHSEMVQFTLFLSLQLLTMSTPMIFHSYDLHKIDYSDFATLHIPGKVPEL
jgi:hypothetical protein